MTTIVGIPAHALLVHGIVVLAPLTALLEILCALWPSARRRLVWLVLALAVGVTVLTPLTTSAGEWLYDREPQHSAILELHAQRGEWMIYFAVGATGGRSCPGGSALAGISFTGPSRGKVFAVVVAVLAVVVGLTAISRRRADRPLGHRGEVGRHQ